jgi:H+/Cl- antiporter ClcA
MSAYCPGKMRKIEVRSKQVLVQLLWRIGRQGNGGLYGRGPPSVMLAELHGSSISAWFGLAVIGRAAIIRTSSWKLSGTGVESP